MALDGLDLAAYEWRESDAGVELHLWLAERAAGSGETTARLVAEVERLPGATRVHETATYTAVHLAFSVRVPACGYAVYRLEARDGPRVPIAVRTGENWLENELLRIEIGAQGLVDVTDKRTGRTLHGLHRVEDVGDAGDLYDFCRVSAPDPGAVLEECSCTPGVSRQRADRRAAPCHPVQRAGVPGARGPQPLGAAGPAPDLDTAAAACRMPMR